MTVLYRETIDRSCTSRSESKMQTGPDARNPRVQITMRRLRPSAGGAGNTPHVHVSPFQRQNGISVNVHPSGALRMARVEPLVPELVNERIIEEDDDNDDADQLERFKCVICLEFMDDPAGCGKCSSRFCHACLSRFVRSGSHREGKARCPTCRVEMNSGLVRDEDLQKEIASGHTVQCRFAGCTEQLLLPKVVDHESKCMHAMVKCRYCNFGCSWKGKRGLLPAHETDDCNLAKVSTLVEQFRLLKAEHSTRLDIVHHQAAGLARSNAALRQNMQQNQRASTSNLFAILEYCHLVTCSTPHFLYNNEKWISFFKPLEGSATVANFLVFLPLTILSFCTALSGTRKLIQSPRIFQPQSEEESILLADAILSACIGALGSVMIVANFADSKSSRTWNRYKLSNLMGSPPLIGDILALSSFTIVVSILEVLDAGVIKCIVLWFLLSITSAFFPALVMLLSEQAAMGGLAQDSMPLPTEIVSHARAFEPILFGLRYSLIAHLFGAIPCLDAAVLINLLPRISKTEKLFMKNAFFEGLPKITYVAYFGAQTAIVIGSKYIRPADVADFLVRPVLSFACLLLVNFLNHQAFALAANLAAKMILQAKMEVNGRSQGPRRDYNLLGMITFGIWICALAIIAQF
eukprot:scaffold992_cov116-Cylindrotheca_fusiformis.AAC.24